MGSARAVHIELIKILKTKPCADCGHSFPPDVMDFDHVRGVKVAKISRLVRSSTESLLEELAKVELVCANCHRLRGISRRKKKKK